MLKMAKIRLTPPLPKTREQENWWLTLQQLQQYLIAHRAQNPNPNSDEHWLHARHKLTLQDITVLHGHLLLTKGFSSTPAQVFLIKPLQISVGNSQKTDGRESTTMANHRIILC